MGDVKRPRTAHEGDDHAFGFDARCGLCQNPDLASKVAAASPSTTTEAARDHLPDEREVARWDREHRRECQEASCTLPHRMLAFADWYIVIAAEMERTVRELRAAAIPGPALDERLRKRLASLRRGDLSPDLPAASRGYARGWDDALAAIAREYAAIPGPALDGDLA